MIVEQFVIVHQYVKGTPLDKLISDIRKDCLKISSTAKVPNLGDHTTSIPTFKTSVCEAKQIVMALNISRAYHEAVKRNHIDAKTEKLDFFRNPNNDAFILRVALPKGYSAMVEKCREEISSRTVIEWVFPLLENKYNPHICILEERGLYEKIKPLIRGMQKRFIAGVKFSLPFPQLMIKVKEGEGTRWEVFG